MIWYVMGLRFKQKSRTAVLRRYNFIFGLVAQLGERSVRIREVEGSNPFRSTIPCKSEHRIFRKTYIRVCAYIEER